MTATNALTSDVARRDLGHRASVRTKTRTRLRAVPDADAAHAETVRDLWDAYKTTGAPWARDRLVLEYAPYTKRVAERLGRTLPANIDQRDLVSWGMIGLIDALDKFAPDRGIKFESYAMTRIQGTIIDALRSYDWTPRAVRRNARAVHDAVSRLEHRLHRTPSRAEVASELMVSEPSLSRMMAEADASRLEPLAGQGTPASGGAPPGSNPGRTRTRRATPSGCSRTRNPIGCWPMRSARCRTASASSSCCPTSSASRWPPSDRHWASPRVGSASSARRRSSTCAVTWQPRTPTFARASRPRARREALDASRHPIGLSRAARDWSGASVAEPADAPGLGPGVRKDVGVRVSPLAPILTCAFREPARTPANCVDTANPIANGLLTEGVQSSA